MTYCVGVPLNPPTPDQFNLACFTSTSWFWYKLLMSYPMLVFRSQFSATVPVRGERREQSARFEEENMFLESSKTWTPGSADKPAPAQVGKIARLHLTI